MQKVARVIPYRKLRRGIHFFDYRVPKKLEAKIAPGSIVEIPLGKQHLMGMVVSVSNNPESTGYEIKEISGIAPKELQPSSFWAPVLSEAAFHYFSSMSLFFKLLLPEIPKKKHSSQSGITELAYKPIPKETVTPLTIIKKTTLVKYLTIEQKIAFYHSLIQQTEKTKQQIIFIFPTYYDLEGLAQTLHDYTDSISLYHNTLSKNARYAEYQKIKDGSARIILGTRSALFSPFAADSLIIIDAEENENHKQEEPNPRYNVKWVAQKITEYSKCSLILTSAAPSIETLFNVHQGKFDYHELSDLPKSAFPKIIDRNDEFKRGNYKLISEELLQEAQTALKKNKQIFLFLNRKGGATYISCSECGHIFVSPESQLPLTQHHLQKLKDFHAVYEEDMPLSCPKCQSYKLKLQGAGTERLHDQAKTQFPGKKIIRLDLESQEEHAYSENEIAEADIIIGTQYAFHFINWHRLGTIGVISADTLLHLPDYRNTEKSFSLLYALCTHATTADTPVYIQTFNANHYLFSALKKMDLRDFYISEITERKSLRYPPFSRLISVIVQHESESDGNKRSQEIYTHIAHILSGKTDVQVYPPLLAHGRKVRGRFRWNILIKYTNGSNNFDFLNQLPLDILIDTDPESLI